MVPLETVAELVGVLAEVWNPYAGRYDVHHPVLCIDEQPVTQVRETDRLLGSTDEHAPRVGYAYGRALVHQIARAVRYGRRWTGSRR